MRRALSARNKRERARGAGRVFSITFARIIGPIIGLLFVILGHCAAYKRVRLYRCADCRSEYPEVTV